MSNPIPLIRSRRVASRGSRGRGRAIGWLLAILCMAIVGSLVYPVLTGGRGESPSKSFLARSDLRSVGTAIESYRVEWDEAPPVAPLDFRYNLGSTHRMREWRAEAGPILGMPHGLTTPIAYISSYFFDPMGKVRGGALLYYRQADEWILLSAGMDEDYDLQDPRPFFRGSGEPDPSILDFTYDPTNGVKSNGDIWRWSPRRDSDATTDTLPNAASDPRFR